MSSYLCNHIRGFLGTFSCGNSWKEVGLSVDQQDGKLRHQSWRISESNSSVLLSKVQDSPVPCLYHLCRDEKSGQTILARVVRAVQRRLFV